MQLLANGKQQFIDSSGAPLASGKVYFYAPATLTPSTTYQDAAGTIPNTNPVTLDGSGQAIIWGNGTYRQIVKDSSGNQIWDQTVATPDLNAPVAGLSGASGAALIGFNPTGTGAAATTVQAALDTTNHLPTGQFFSNTGARVDRIADRVFAGDAVKHNGADQVTQPDWLTTYEIAKGRAGGSMMYSTAGITNSSGTRAANTLMVGAQAANLLAQYNAIAIRALATNNSTLANVYAYGGYFEGFRESTAAGGAYAIELDTVNYAGVVEIDPYQQLNGQTVAMQIAGGAEFPAAGQFASSCAINIRKNGSTYERGIIFGSDSLTGATGTAGTAPAIVFGNGHQIMWYGAANTTTSSITCTGTTTSGGIDQRFLDGAINWNNSAGKPLFQVATQSTHVNYLSIRSAATGFAAQLTAQGDDANVDIQLVTKGTGLVWVGAYTAGAITQAGYITVKDTGGVVRRLLVG